MDRSHFALLWIEAILDRARFMDRGHLLAMDRGHFAFLWIEAILLWIKAILPARRATPPEAHLRAGPGKVNRSVTFLHR